MRLLADENIPRLVVEFICSRGHDAIWVGKVAPGIKDREVLSLATTQKRTLITFDTDYYHITVPPVLMSWPVMLAASSEARKTANAAASSELEPLSL